MPRPDYSTGGMGVYRFREVQKKVLEEYNEETVFSWGPTRAFTSHNNREPMLEMTAFRAGETVGHVIGYYNCGRCTAIMVVDQWGVETIHGHKIADMEARWFREQYASEDSQSS